ncbi:hypothetical protein [Ferruginibacter sp. SUN106]|uniref:hypothetical protein n=1 Tax=Ferruginibacter sp. SUN106 TaxID=2978348 RepID=UPI003D36E680
MKAKFFSIVSLSFSLLVFASCKKQNKGDEALPKPNVPNSLANTIFQKILLDQKMVNVPISFNLEKASYYLDSRTSIVPIDLVSVDKKIATTKYFVTKTDENGKVNAENYYVILSAGKNNVAVTPDLLSGKKISADFDGAIIRYDKDNNFVSSNHFENGNLSPKTDKIEVRKSKSPEPTPGYAPLNQGCSYITVDWYWQTYVNGVLVNEEYLYTTQIVVCEDGDGSGGGTGSTTCEQAQAFLNAGSAQSGTLNSVDVFNNGMIWKKTYNWLIFQAGTWGLLSFDQATFEKIHYASNNTDRWEFIDFQHQHLAEIGANIGGTRTFLDLGATINILPGRTSVWDRVDYSVTSKPLNCLPAVTTVLNSQKSFNAPNTFVIVE